MTRRLVLLAVTAVALAAPASATAGGWATVSLDSVPDGVAAAEPWEVELTILQHGVTPLEGVAPRVIVTGWGGKSRRAFAARPTGRPGVYRASVTFPGPGTWNYAVDDGFSATHAYPPVRIGGGDGPRAAAAGFGAPAGGAGPAAGGDGPDVVLALVAAAVAGLAVGLASATLRRRREGPVAAGG